MIRIACIAIIISFQSTVAMESLCKKFSSWSFYKKDNLTAAEKEWHFYKKLPTQHKSLILTFKGLQSKYTIPLDLLKIIIGLIIDKDFCGSANCRERNNPHYQTDLAFLYHLINCNLFRKESLEAIKHIYQNNVYFRIRKNQEKIFKPLYAPYNRAYIVKIQKSIIDRNIKSLKKICNKPCLPTNALWNYAFLFASYVESLFPKEKKRIKKTLCIITDHCDPIPHVKPDYTYRCCPLYENQSLYPWLKDQRVYLSHENNFDSVIIPHLCMDKLVPYKSCAQRIVNMPPFFIDKL